MNSSEYTPIETVATGPDATIVRAVRRTDGLAVLLKIARGATHESLRRLLKEREIGREADPDTVLSPIDLIDVDGQAALVLLDNHGHALETDLDRPLGIDLSLMLAIQIARKLSDLHAHGVVHRDLKPDNVFVTATRDDVRLTGLGVALESIGTYRPSTEAGLIEGTFAYMAPEQTGQTGLLVDQRADLYSLGIVLYRMLTGRLPFVATDALGWIHAQIAEEPPPLGELMGDVPPAVAAIVDKLLAKDPDARYQTARGLAADLDEALASWRGRRAIPTFPLGRRDVPERLLVPHRLYRREAELRELSTAFDVVGGAPGRLMVLTGPAGIGKSSIARALEAGVRARGGVFLQGKHEELRREVPYFAVGQALEQLAERLLMENEDTLLAWRARLRSSLGGAADLLTTLAPKFALVLGEPAAERTTIAPSADRFRLFFRRFLAEVASADQPLTLFLDDLQWADAATIVLLEHVLASPEVDSVLTIGAFRSSELDDGHPLAAALERLRCRGHVTEIPVGPLEPRTIAELLGDTFRCPPEETTPLASLLFERTA